MWRLTNAKRLRIRGLMNTETPSIPPAISAFMQEMGRKGGLAKSAAKTRAARRNAVKRWAKVQSQDESAAAACQGAATGPSEGRTQRPLPVRLRDEIQALPRQGADGIDLLRVTCKKEGCQHDPPELPETLGQPSNAAIVGLGPDLPNGVRTIGCGASSVPNGHGPSPPLPPPPAHGDAQCSLPALRPGSGGDLPLQAPGSVLLPDLSLRASVRANGEGKKAARRAPCARDEPSGGLWAGQGTGSASTPLPLPT